MLRWTLIFLVVSVVAGVLQFTQFTGVPLLPAEMSLLLSFGFLTPFIAFLVLGLLALGSPKLDSNNDPPFLDGLKALLGWR